MTVGVIDDETANRQVIKNILSTYCPEVTVTVDEGQIDAAVEALNAKRPELLFLDIELRSGTGFDIIARLSYKPEIIFTTAYSQYAINAIKVRAFDYLLKPINEEELVAGVNNYLAKRQELDTVEQKSQAGSNFFNTSTNEGKIALNYNEIYYFEGSGSYTYCITRTKKYIFSKNLGELEKDLPKEFFFRTHHSYLVNLSKVNKIEIRRNGKLFLENNDVIPLAQRKIKEFKAFFQLNANKRRPE